MTEFIVPFGKQQLRVRLAALPPQERLVEMAMAKVSYGVAGAMKAKLGNLAKVEKLTEPMAESEVRQRFTLAMAKQPSVCDWPVTGLELVSVEMAPESEGSKEVKAAKAEAAKATAELEKQRAMNAMLVKMAREAGVVLNLPE